MRQNVYDLATDILKARIGKAYGVMEQQFKTTNPYRKVPMSAKERIYQYSQITPEAIQMARQTMGDEVVDNYLNSIQTTINRSQGHGNVERQNGT